MHRLRTRHEPAALARVLVHVSLLCCPSVRFWPNCHDFWLVHQAWVHLMVEQDMHQCTAPALGLCTLSSLQHKVSLSHAEPCAAKLQSCSYSFLCSVLKFAVQQAVDKRSMSELVLLLMLASPHAAYEHSVCGYPLLQDLTTDQVPPCKLAPTP